MSPEHKFEILKIELSLIQATLDKYDDLIFRGRNFFVTLWLASIGLAFPIQSAVVPLLAVVLSLLYWFLEGMMRHQYWYKYVDRYRFLRDNINTPDCDLADLTVYDLTNELRRKPYTWWGRVRMCFFKVEPSVLYGVMGVSAAVIWLLLHTGVVRFIGAV